MKKYYFFGAAFLISCVIIYSQSGCPVCGRDHIIHSFTQTLGLPEKERNVKCHDVVEVYGEPDRIEFVHREDDVLMYLYYDLLTFRFHVWDPNADEDPYAEAWKLDMIVTKDPSHIFGRGIHVGITKRQVKWLFRNAEPVLEAEPATEYWDHSDIVIIEFTYDVNDIVTSITYYCG